MKNLITLMSLCSFFILFQNEVLAQGHFKIRNDDFIHIGGDVQKSLTFGNQNTILPNNGFYAIEALNGGLNFWKPWPNPVSYGNYVLFLRADQNIGVGTAGSGSFKLDVSGKIRCTSLTQTSDARFKQNILPLKGSLQKVLALEGVTYNFKSVSRNEQTTDLTQLSEIKRKTIEGSRIEVVSEPQIGLIAQEVQKIVPEVVESDEEGYLSINYTSIVPILIEAVKEQQKQIEELKREVAVLKEK